MKVKQWMVTIKLKVQHSPREKLTGPCPIAEGKICTDMLGAHHTVLAHGETEEEVRGKFEPLHITRIEEV